MDKQRAIEQYLRLVNMQSISETEGEITFGDFLYQEIQNIGYFNEHPGAVWKVPVKLGKGEGSCVFALMKCNFPTPETLILLSHYDTVGIEDYGELAEMAFDPIELTRRLKENPSRLSIEAKMDLDSGDYLFGRGSADMKWGLSAGIEALRHFHDHPDELKTNLLLVSTPDEEVNSRGMLEAVKELVTMQEAGLTFIACLVSEPDIASDRPENQFRIHTGCAGKCLPCLVVRGKETHVGEPFFGFNPNLIVSNVVNRMELNPVFSDVLGKASTPVPVCLKQADLKSNYTVQTPIFSYAYFNVMTLTSSPLQVMDRFIHEIEIACDEALTQFLERHQQIEQIIGKKINRISPVITVLAYPELTKRLNELNVSLKADDKIQDVRERAVDLVKRSLDALASDDILVVPFFAPPYYPHRTKNATQERIVQSTTKFIKQVANQTTFTVDPVYQGLSDMSYLGLEGDVDPKQLGDWFAGFNAIYDLPLEALSRLDIPFLNLGPNGKDAHKVSERIDLKYSFDKALPYFILMIKLLGERT